MEVFREDFVLGHPRVSMHYWTLNDKMHKQQLECGPITNVMAEYRWRPLFNAAKFG